MLKHAIATPMVSIMCVYINSQLSLNKHAEFLVLAQQEVAAVSTGVSPCCGLPAAFAGVEQFGVPFAPSTLPRPPTSSPSLCLAACRFSMKGPVHTCGNSNYLQINQYMWRAIHERFQHSDKWQAGPVHTRWPLRHVSQSNCAKIL